MPLEFRILGPFEVHLNGEVLALGARQQRALLAALTLRANELVSSERLIDELWPEDPPDTADHLVHVYISRLRKALRDSGRTILVTRPPGYELLLERGQLDLHRFDDLMSSAKASTDAGRFVEASEQLREGLALWRGPALADLASESFARAEAERLNEQRLSATEDLIRSDLAAGRPDLVPELKSLVAQHPLRERLHGLLIVALYREGRQAEALDEYAATRAVLADQLGIDPSEELQEIYRRVLAQDPSLSVSPAPVEMPSHTTPPAPVQRPLGNGTRIGLLVAVIALAIVVVGWIASLSRPNGDATSATVRSDIGLFVGTSETPTSKFGFEGRATFLAVDGKQLWVADDQAGTITRVTTDTLQADPAISSGIEPVSIVAGDGRAWVLDPYAGQIKALRDGQVDQGFATWHSSAPVDAVYARDSLWVVDAGCACVFKLDAATGAKQEQIAEPFAEGGPTRIDAGPGGIWVLDAVARSLVRLAPWNGRPIGAPITLPAAPTDVAVSHDTIWVTMEADDLVKKLSSSGALRADVAVPGGPSNIVADADGAWVITSRGGRLIHLSGSTGTPVPLVSPPLALTIGVGGAWVSIASGSFA